MKQEVPLKYSFPLFTKHNSTDYLIKNSQIRVSDLWAFWKLIIDRYAKKYSGNKKFLLAHFEQAKYFYEAAEIAPIKSQPLLYYYSFMNLVKVVININYIPVYGTNFTYSHGIDFKYLNQQTKIDDLYLEVKGLKKNEPKDNKSSKGKTTKVNNQPELSLAYTFMMQMGDKFSCPPKFKIQISELIQSCIGIHKTYCETNNYPEQFFEVNEPKLFKNGKNLVVEFDIMDCDNELSKKLVNAGYNVDCDYDDKGNANYKWSESICMNKYNPSKFDYYWLSQKIKEKGIWYYTDGNKFNKFISTNQLRLSTESTIYAIMFFLGSITRYHPYLFDKLLSDKEMWLFSEFLKTQPKQFLYAVTSRTIESEVLKPNSCL